MITALAAFGLVLAVALAWKSPWAPATGALAGIALALVTRAATTTDLTHALGELWRPAVSIVGIMITTACAAELGVFTRIAAWIEPRTRGPVKHAFHLVYVIAALTAALLSNDAAILLLTPVVIELLRAVYPRRHPRFVVPFAFAVFVAAGVAPLPTSNPMNLVVAYRAGIGFNTYAVHMIPVALVGWVVAYAALAWWFREPLADEAPALGQLPPGAVSLGGPARLVLAVVFTSIASYPLLAVLGQPIWPVAAIAAAVCTAITLRAGGGTLAIIRGVSWELVPFLAGILVLATALAHAGLTARLATLYDATPAPLATIGAVAAAGSALIGNHAMALLHSLALTGAPDAHVLAALIGGDLGPRLLPIGSLAGLLWLHELRRQGVTVPLRTFVTVGAIVTLPSLLASLALLSLLAR